MTILTAGAGRTRSLGFDGDWAGNVTPAEFNGEIIVFASATLLTVVSASESTYYEYTGSFKFTKPAPAGLAMGEVGLSGFPASYRSKNCPVATGFSHCSDG